MRRGSWYAGAVSEGPRSTKWSGAGWRWSTAGLRARARDVIPVPELSKQCLASSSSTACLGLKHETSVAGFSGNDAHSSRAQHAGFLAGNKLLFFLATGRHEKLLVPDILVNPPWCLRGIKLLLNMRKKSWNWTPAEKVDFCTDPSQRGAY